MEIREGDVILSKVVFTDLSEIKKRPVLVINSIHPSDFLALPITTSDTKAFHIPIDNDDFEEGGIPKPSKVLIPKPYILDKSLYIKHYGKLKRKSLENIIRIFIKRQVGLHHRLFHKTKPFVPSGTYIPYAGRVYDAEEIKALVDSSLDFWLTAGRFAKQFEEELAEFFGVKHCLLTNSGSSANLLAISALTSPKLGEKRLKPGDEVITAAAAFPTTVNPIIQNNLIPVFLDIDVGTYNIQADKIEDAISDKTKAIFLAHTLGNPFNLEAIMKIAQKHNLWVIEDNCDAVGSKYKGQYTGTFGHIATFSFYPAHHITMGEGGALVTNDTQLKRLIESFRDWGRDCWCEPGHDNTCGKRFEWQLGSLPYGYDHKYVYSHIGYNLKVTDMQAAVGVAQLKKLSGFIQARKENYRILYEEFKKYDDYFILPEVTDKSEPCWFGFPLTIKENVPFSRIEIVNYLEENKIATRLLFSGNIIRHPGFENVKFRVYNNLRNTDFIMTNTFWMGVYPGIREEEMNYIIEKIREFMERYK
jgi:CDP-6-deoxy-D-xylo-4-hexulose-3-dehydrase